MAYSAVTVVRSKVMSAINVSRRGYSIVNRVGQSILENKKDTGILTVMGETMWPFGGSLSVSGRVV